MKKILFYSLLGILMTSGIGISHAAYQYPLLEPLPNIEGGGGTIKQIGIEGYVGYVFKLALALAVLIATVVIIYAGFEYMLSESVTNKTTAKNRIRDASIGLLGALTSYLILQTIDPRLVQINTTIPPICPKGQETVSGSVCDPTDSIYLQRRLEADLKNLSSERKLSVLEFENQKNELDKEILSLEAKSSRGEITDEEYIIQSTKLSTQRAEIEVKENMATAEGLGLVQYRLAHEQIYPVGTPDFKELARYTADTVDNNLHNGRYRTDSENVIQNSYNQKINELLSISPQTESSAMLIQNLKSQRNFYIDQVKEEVKLRDMSNLAEISPAGKVDLKNKQKEYQNNLADPKKVTESGITPAQYAEIMKTRIDQINITLGKSTK